MVIGEHWAEQVTMIIGVGLDLIDIRRIERVITRFGDRFLIRLFTIAERRLCKQTSENFRRRTAAAYARRFAAKEACVKALGTGFSGGITWRDISVVNSVSGQPIVRLTGLAAKRLTGIVPSDMTAQIDVSLSDDYPFAQAIVIISAVSVQKVGSYH